MRYDSTGSALGFGVLSALVSPWLLGFYGVKLLEEWLEDESARYPADDPQEPSSNPVEDLPDGLWVDGDELFRPKYRRN